MKAALSQVQAELKHLIPPGSMVFTKPDHLHLTLRFLGQVEPSRVPELSKRIRDTLSGFGRVELVCERLGCFPDFRFPRVVWAGVHDDGERLMDLHRKIEGAVKELCWHASESRFVGHVTLARPKQLKQAETERLAGFVRGAVGRPFGSWRCKEVELIRSEMSAQGSRYTTLDVFPL